MASVQVLYFAAIRDLVGLAEEEVELSESRAQMKDLIQELTTLHPELEGRLGSVRFALNEEFVKDDAEISPGDIIAVIPPVAGG